jgi:hypothetical protein
MTAQLCQAAARASIKADPEKAKTLLGCFLHMAQLARVDGALAFPMDFPIFVQGVIGACMTLHCIALHCIALHCMLDGKDRDEKGGGKSAFILITSLTHPHRQASGTHTPSPRPSWRSPPSACAWPPPPPPPSTSRPTPATPRST